MKPLMLFGGYLICLALVAVFAWPLPPLNFVVVIAAFTAACVVTSQA
jgi:hypothetical protein